MENKDKATDDRKESIYEQKIMQVKKSKQRTIKKAEKKRTNAK